MRALVNVFSQMLDVGEDVVVILGIVGVGFIFEADREAEGSRALIYNIMAGLGRSQEALSRYFGTAGPFSFDFHYFINYIIIGTIAIGAVG